MNCLKKTRASLLKFHGHLNVPTLQSHLDAYPNEMILMAQLVKTGNSKGVRIPKILIEKAHLEGKELSLQVVEEGFMILPSKKPREGWAESIRISQPTHGIEAIDREWLDAPLLSSDEWDG